MWTIIEVFKDVELLRRVREELEKASPDGININKDIDRILTLPLLQSIYAEVLRLRVEVQSVFYSERENIIVNQWQFPKKSLLLVPVGPAHMDADFWNTRDGEYPLDRFWADRFLIYPNDGRSGPQRKLSDQPRSYHSNDLETSDHPEEPKYVTAGLADAFMPFGIGERVCPGRFFARRHVVAFCAHLVSNFEIEILSKKAHFKSSTGFYGMGVQKPSQRIAFRIKRR